jgi:Cell Wall Hydrolase
MSALRTRSTGAFSGPFVLSALCAAFTPTVIGYQDLAAFFARQPDVSERWGGHLIAAPFGIAHAATFNYSRPIGTAMPEPSGAQPVNFDPRSLDVKAWSVAEPAMARPALPIEYPTVNRRLKGDRMPLPQSSPSSSKQQGLPPLQPIDAPASQPASPPVPATVPRPKDAEQIDPAPIPDALQVEVVASAAASSSAAHNQRDAREADGEDDAMVADRPPEIPAAGESDPLEAPPSSLASLSFLDEGAAERDAQLYFGVGAMGLRGALQPWQPGAAPVPVSPPVDPDLKLSALERPADAGPGGETVADKDDGDRNKSPAERLGLTGKPRAKAEKCIADAVYFEARGEPLRGQMAVAQVVMNRVFSGRYPNNVCGVVYQNANRHLACQFTFACEGKDLSRIDEPEMWEQAKRIAKDTLDGKIWLTEVGHATHYHAYWVHPSWVHEMARLYKLGVHTFYRPRAWGDGSDAPNWGSVPVTTKPVSTAAPNPDAAKGSAASNGPVAAAKLPEAVESPDGPAGKNRHTAKL